MGISVMKGTEESFNFLVEWKQILSHTWEKWNINLERYYYY